MLLRVTPWEEAPCPSARWYGYSNPTDSGWCVRRGRSVNTAKTVGLRGCESFVVCAPYRRSSVRLTDKGQRDLLPCPELHVPERLTKDSQPLSSSGSTITAP